MLLGYLFSLNRLYFPYFPLNLFFLTQHNIILLQKLYFYTSPIDDMFAQTSVYIFQSPSIFAGETLLAKDG